MKTNNHIVYKLLLLLVAIALPTGLLAQKNDKSKIIKLSAKEYAKETSKGVVLVDYWATWCGPCKKMEPILEDIAKETKVKVAKLNVDDYKAFVRTQKVNNIPTMIIYKDGKEVERISGAHTKEELLQKLTPLLK